MPVIIYDRKAVQRALNDLAQQLKQIGAPVGNVKWVFPQKAKSDRLPTWTVPIASNHCLILGFKPEFRWWWTNPSLRRCPFLLTIGKNARDGITPIVEVNIPRPMRRTVNGCFAKDGTGNMWLYHRGSKLTVHGNQKIPKKYTLLHFRVQRKIVSAYDDGLTTDFIPVVKLTSGKAMFRKSLIEFVDEINRLKSTW